MSEFDAFLRLRCYSGNLLAHLAPCQLRHLLEGRIEAVDVHVARLFGTPQEPASLLEQRVEQEVKVDPRGCLLGVDELAFSTVDVK